MIAAGPSQEPPVLQMVLYGLAISSFSIQMKWARTLSGNPHPSDFSMTEH